MQCFPFTREQRGGEQSNGLVNKMGMETGLKVYPVNPATLIFLNSKDISNKMVLVEEPVTPKSV
jgi:hypothetical protein